MSDYLFEAKLLLMGDFSGDSGSSLGVAGNGSISVTVKRLLFTLC